MIHILFNDCKIPANNDGTPLEIPIYWTQEIIDGIAQAFADGDWEPVPEPTPPPPEPNWEGFNLALLQDNDFQIAAAVNPLVTNALTTALNNIMLGFVSAQGFSPYVETFINVAGVTPQQREGWATIAAANNLPAEVVAIMAG